ncbi:MAG: fatty acyl-AMP ligase, partial [Gemmatimonadetes bacterium]|nr:fatty acyl-AMP ligase [Gemmatimonadota bacterium]
APSCAARAQRSIVHVLSARAQETPDALAFRFVPQKGSPQEITWAGLERRVRTLAVRLEGLGLRETPVLLLHPAGLEFVEAFYACLAAGIVAVPAFPPRANRTLPRLASMAVDSGAAAALTTALQVDRARDTAASLDALAGLRWFATDEVEGPDDVDEPGGAGPLAAAGAAEDVAYLQYTSGSTSEPKGVMVTHANLLANSDTIREGFGHDANSRALSWLPHFHDMGLVDGIVQPVYSGFPATLMDPMTFLQEPARWLEAIAEYRITHSGGPNFAYDLCARRVTPDPARLDLASWDVAYNGAEPVRAETLARFAERFARCGFRRRSFYPAYGLAEATLKVSGGSRGDGPSVLAVNREALAAGEVRGKDANTELVGSGRPTGETTVRIVDAETATALGDERVGEIWVGGPSVAIGYWRRPEATEETFGARLADGSGPWLRTGDLGFTRAGEVFVTGRRKDLVIVRGRNVYPQDLERTAESVDDTLRSAGAAAFSVEQDDEERLVLVLEVERRAPADPAALFAAIRSAIVETHEVDPVAILLVKPFGVPKTSSGKVRRAACRLEYLEGTLPVLAEW